MLVKGYNLAGESSAIKIHSLFSQTDETFALAFIMPYIGLFA